MINACVTPRCYSGGPDGGAGALGARAPPLCRALEGLRASLPRRVLGGLQRCNRGRRRPGPRRGDHGGDHRALGTLSGGQHQGCALLASALLPSSKDVDAEAALILA
jgi:hypothetical protein